MKAVETFTLGIQHLCVKAGSEVTWITDIYIEKKVARFSNLWNENKILRAAKQKNESQLVPTIVVCFAQLLILIHSTSQRDAAHQYKTLAARLAAHQHTRLAFTPSPPWPGDDNWLENWLCFHHQNLCHVQLSGC